MKAIARAEAAQHRDEDPHLRSCKEVIGYHIQATDGEIGHVQGMLVDDETWAIRYLVVDTNNWWLGHLVLVAPQSIKQVSWSNTEVTIDLTREQIRHDHALDYSIMKPEGILVLKPHAPLSKEDFAGVSAAVDAYLSDHAKLHGVLIHSKGFPGWENFGGFNAHMHFVRDHHKKVERVALVDGQRDRGHRGIAGQALCVRRSEALSLPGRWRGAGLAEGGLRALILEVRRVKAQMVGDERGDEEIAVVVAFLHPEVQRHAGSLARIL